MLGSVTMNRSRGALKRAWLRLPYSRRLEYAVALPKLRVWASERARAAYPSLQRGASFLQTSLPPSDTLPFISNSVLLAVPPCVYGLKPIAIRTRVLIGLDTFTGLPEAWASWRTAPQGRFDAGGAPPVIDDPRVSFRIGLFQTLPGLLRELPELLRGRALVVHMDADLHSSTIYALTQLDPFLPGVVLVFDEWANPLHEFRALHDYCRAYRREYEVLAVWRHLRKTALRIKVSPLA